MTPRKYASAMAFKQALERRLRDDTDSGVTWARKRQILVFDRFLARIFAELKETVILKGGLGLEMRLERARTTKDVDLRFTGNPDNILEKLQAAARMNLEDFMTFEVELDKRHPTIQGDSVKYDGFRFRAKCLLAGKIYGHVFGVDIGVGDPIYGQPKTLLTSDTLAFAMIAPTEVQVYPIESHIAEKLHAYTMPRSRPNSRVKDLPDIALIATMEPIVASELREALSQTFTYRDTHPFPTKLPGPPEAWAAPYAAMAQEDVLPWPTLDEVIDVAKAFLDPILEGEIEGSWDAAMQCWR